MPHCDGEKRCRMTLRKPSFADGRSRPELVIHAAGNRTSTSYGAAAAWREPRGRHTFSDAAIAAALTVRAVYRLALRQAEGLVRSIFALLGVALPVPDHTTLSRRGRTLRPDRSVDGGAASTLRSTAPG